ncbi:uncharacterized protein LOC117070978 isoform X2 [Trachypithecus francoisi]|uniref:uncharacterized protein LOC117070978 isoform X2 n=1 Tax=Trachypithecus francoisi TaxID=54180 RepID=UPI00141BB3A7|nr:uncharacterized protein LOC117070978 isoform X2 [Trachypithecus francoisi]
MSVSVSQLYSPWCVEAQALPGAPVSCTELVSSSAQVGSLALMGIDGDPGGKLVFGPLSLGQCQSARHPAPSALKLRTFLEPLASALSCVSSSVQVVPPGLEQHRSSTQEVPLALTGMDGETGGRLALDVLFLGQWPLAWCPVPDALKLRSFLAPWSPALSCVSFSAQVGSMALSSIDGEPGRRVVLGPNRPQASVRQPGAHPPGALKLRPSLAPWSPALSCVNFSSQTGPLALTGIGFIGKQAQGCPVSATSQYFTWISSHVPWRMSRCELACPTYFPTWRSFWTHVLQLSPRW